MNFLQERIYAIYLLKDYIYYAIRIIRIPTVKRKEREAVSMYLMP